MFNHTTRGNSYDVFLSFKSEDTGKNFTNHLSIALNLARFHTFEGGDNEESRREEDINLELRNKATQESKIRIIVFSQTYASSSWCLDQLVVILEHKIKFACIILPIFYHVENEVHEVEILFTIEANELFNFHVFGEKNPISEDYNYKEYSEEVIEWCKGLSLGLQVIGSSLAGKSKDKKRGTWRLEPRFAGDEFFDEQQPKVLVVRLPSMAGAVTPLVGRSSGRR
ncbi:hypothetical protein BC332_18450 [Capsicum chinense]|nr:hypothetical protein BC332_18450 [Capsicum chinense]